MISRTFWFLEFVNGVRQRHESYEDALISLAVATFEEPLRLRVGEASIYEVEYSVPTLDTKEEWHCPRCHNVARISPFNGMGTVHCGYCGGPMELTDSTSKPVTESGGVEGAEEPPAP